MDAYNVQFIIIAILLILLSIFHISRISSIKYPGIVVDILFHGAIIFIGLYIFYYFYIVNLIKKRINDEFSQRIYDPELKGSAIENIPVEIRYKIGKALSKKESDDETDPLPEVENTNKTIFYNALTACIIFFVVCVGVTIGAKYFNYPIELRHIIYLNIFLFIATLFSDFIMIGVVQLLNIIPLSDFEISKAVYERLKYNFNNT
jgi:hypothetical protein